jgi:hypothetical protein
MHSLAESESVFCYRLGPVTVSTELLLNEKTVTSDERRQLLTSIKQSFAYVGVVLGLLLERGYAAGGSEAAFVAVPFIVLAGTAYVYSNTVTLLLLTAHLEMVDSQLASRSAESVPLWHRDVAAPMARWGLVVRRRRGRVLNPYYALSMTLLTIGTGAGVMGVLRGRIYLTRTLGAGYAWVFVGAVLLQAIVILHGFVVTAMSPLDAASTAVVDPSVTKP